MYLLLGAESPIGHAFEVELQRRRADYLPVRLDQLNLADLHVAYDCIRRTSPEFVINACWSPAELRSEHTDADKQAILYSKVLVPQTLAQACRMRNVSWGHVAPGSVFQGARILQKGKWYTELDMNRASILQLIRANSTRIRGFSEADEPNHSFVCPPCDFLSGAAALGEQAIKSVGEGYIWRHGVLLRPELNGLGNSEPEPSRRNGRKPFYSSVTNVSEYAAACLDLWEGRAPAGIYHVVNPGAADVLSLASVFNTAVFKRGCLLDDGQLRAAGIRLKPAADFVPSDSEQEVSNASPNSFLHRKLA